MSDWSNRRVLVTGATGFVGSHVAERLVREGAHVRVLVREPRKLIDSVRDRVEVVRGDLLQPDCFSAATADCEVVFHVAGWLSTPNRLEIARAVNVTATRQLAETARSNNVQRFISTSSIAVYGPVISGTIDETWPHWPVYAYAETKSLGERAAFETATDSFGVVVLRPAMIYGPRGDAWTTLPVQLAQRGLPMLIGGGHGFSHPVYVGNLVDAYLLAATRPEAIGEAFTICDCDVPWREFYGHYAKMAGKPARSVPAAMATVAAFGVEIAAKIAGRLPRVSRAMLGFTTGQCRFSIDKAKRLLGWEPSVSLDEGLQTTEKWLRESGMIK